MTFQDHLCIGYCPQIDFLMQILTVRQNIEYFCRIKGMKPSQISLFLERYLVYFELIDQIDVKVNKLSRGNKRKVSSIITFAGSPSILLFDEPCSGMDKCSQAKLWNLISAYCKTFSAAIFITTHNIAQAEKYCHRVGILKDGRLISIGKPQYIVKKHSWMYRLIIRYKTGTQIGAIKAIIQRGRPFFLFFHAQQSEKLIYDFDKNQTNCKELIQMAVFELLKQRVIQFFQFYEQNLQNAFNYVQNSLEGPSSLSQDD